MSENVARIVNYTFDEPVQYKKLKIYPVLLKDFFYFTYGSDILTIDKNSIPDPMIISMSYFDFLVAYNDEENKYLEKMGVLLSICTREKDISITRTEKINKFELNIKGEKYDSDDFDYIKTVICEQNMVEIPDFSVQKEIRDKIEEGKKIKARENGTKAASLEDQIVSLSIATGIPLEQIYNMPFRKFIKAIERTDLKMHYEIYLNASLSGFASIKDTSFIKHWLSNIEKEKSDSMIDIETMENKISFKDKK